ncbi:Snf7-domain-containing protein [Atractiella rhizophila]|nr:Snf7-domain-containing protein [Atractiella rhizophila]
MSAWLGSWLGGRKPAADETRNAIVQLRHHLLLLEKREDHLNNKIEEETKKAKANVSTNKRVATAALRQKKLYEGELEKLAGRRQTLEAQVASIESANINMETVKAMKQGADVLAKIHGNLDIDKVDRTMESIREQMDLQEEISNAISQPQFNDGIDEDELRKELEDLEQEKLDEQLVGAGGVPQTLPGVPTKNPTVKQTAQEEEEDAELKELQAALAM